MSHDPEDLEEFEWWCKAYRDDPDKPLEVTQHQLRKLAAGGNCYAQEALEMLPGAPERSDGEREEPVRDVVTVLAEEEAGGYTKPLSPARDINDLDGQEWAERIGASEPSGEREIEPGLGDSHGAPNDYTHDWPQISRAIKDLRGWRCEVCGFQMPSSGLIQTHHINGKKADNKTSNVQVMCVICHGKHHGGTIWPEAFNLDHKAALERHHAEREAEKRERQLHLLKSHPTHRRS